MTGNLSQIVALAAYGNDFLKNNTIQTDFNSSHTTFQSCSLIDFREVRKTFFFSNPKEIVIASGPADWFHYLKNDGCKNLRLYFEKSKDQSFARDYKLAGLVGGGGSWLIEAVYDTYSNYWTNRWEVSDQNAADGRIWTVNYGLILPKKSSRNLKYDNQLVKENLRNTLTEISHFADSQKLENWVERFGKAILTLDSAKPESNYYHKDLLPVGNYSLMARQLVFSAESAWVFGGMGSWNDVVFDKDEDNETYERLSEQLYTSINEAIIAGTTSY
jgi:hypothetical protein